ncbi:hypothetical protein I3843_07G085500 [Carya illinoinensis]|nr:hypothetical protein I3843_07G085500 [Carya illinoinensis]
MSTTKQITENRQVTKNKLFRMAMEGKWEEVAKLFERDEWTQTAKITNSGDTALHIAISVGKEDNVRQLTESIWEPSRLRQVLEIQNDRGNTPLHSAASTGNETPLFMAALHGKKAAFFCLHYICQLVDVRGRFQYSRKNGDTNLAFQIIKLYPELASLINEEGLTPLHLLASKPSAFRSGSQLEGFDKIIYHSKYHEIASFNHDDQIVMTNYLDHSELICTIYASWSSIVMIK